MNYGISANEERFLHAFPLPLAVVPLSKWEAYRLDLPENRTHWRYCAPFCFVSSFGVIEAARGDVTDFASVPVWCPRWVLDDDAPNILWAACAHDTLWRNGGLTASGTRLTLREVNAVFEEGLEILGCPWPKRKIARRAVDLYGWIQKWGKP